MLTAFIMRMGIVNDCLVRPNAALKIGARLTWPVVFGNFSWSISVKAEQVELAQIQEPQTPPHKSICIIEAGSSPVLGKQILYPAIHRKPLSIRWLQTNFIMPIWAKSINARRIQKKT